MPRSCIKVLDTVVFGIPTSASSSRRIFVDCSRYTLSILRCSTCCRPPGPRIIFKRSLAIFEPFVPHFYLCCTHCTTPQNLLHYQHSFHGGTFVFNAKSDTDSLLYSVTTNMTATLNGVYRPHRLAQWSCHCLFQSILLGCQVTLMPRKLFSL